MEFLNLLWKKHKNVISNGCYRGSVVKTLMSTLSVKGYNLYLDHFFNHPLLAEYLQSSIVNKKKNVQRLSRKKTKKGWTGYNRTKHENHCIQRKRKMFSWQQAYMDQKWLNVAEKIVTGKDILKPKYITDYNKNIGGVDIGDARGKIDGKKM